MYQKTTSYVLAAPFLTWHEKTGLLCTQNLTTFKALKFNNFLSKINVVISENVATS